MNVDSCNYFAADSGAKYCDERVRMFVCLSARIPKPHVQTSRKFFCTCSIWPWLSPTLITVQYVMYFRFCGWSCLPISVTKLAHQWAARGEVWCLWLPC